MKKITIKWDDVDHITVKWKNSSLGPATWGDCDAEEVYTLVKRFVDGSYTPIFTENPDNGRSGYHSEPEPGIWPQSRLPQATNYDVEINPVTAKRKNDAVGSAYSEALSAHKLADAIKKAQRYFRVDSNISDMFKKAMDEAGYE